jgi:hypothetical protein
MAGLDEGGFGFCAMGVDAHAGEIRNKLLVSILLGVKDEQAFLALAGRSIVFGAHEDAQEVLARLPTVPGSVRPGCRGYI